MLCCCCLQPQNPFVRGDGKVLTEDKTLYDPCFLVPLFSHYLGAGMVVCLSIISLSFVCGLVPAGLRMEMALFLPLFALLSVCLDAHVDCRLFVGHGVLGFLIAALSSLHKDVRSAACHCLTRFKGHLQKSRFREKPQVCRHIAAVELVLL